jgi:hypothetical protein
MLLLLLLSIDDRPTRTKMIIDCVFSRDEGGGQVRAGGFGVPQARSQWETARLFCEEARWKANSKYYWNT